MMNFPRLLWNKKLYPEFVLTILIIDTVFIRITHGKLRGDEFSDVTYISSHSSDEKTQNVIYSSVLGAIQRVYGNGTNAMGDRRLPEIVMTLPRNRTHFDEHYLAYSNNVFGSHTKYIEEVSKNKHNYYITNDLGGQGRKKRSVLHLYNMVLCATGCNPLSYKGYGCYCGFLGSGYAVDGIDRCCQIHDWCYDTAGCPMFLEYFIPYLWKCYSYHHPVCAFDHGVFGGPGSCAQRLCECDRQLAECLKMYPCPSSKALCTSSPWRLLQNLFMN